jgi:hypothetical protein
LLHWRFAIGWILFALVASFRTQFLIQTNSPRFHQMFSTPIGQRVQQPLLPAPSKSGQSKKARKNTPAVSVPAQAATVLEPGWKPRTDPEIYANAAKWGYVGWALYSGLPAWFALIRPIGRKLLQFWLATLIGFPLLLGLLGVFLVVGGIYAVFGGGAFHFGRRWWFLCHPRTSPPMMPSPALHPTPPLAPSPPTVSPITFQSRMQKLDELLQQGLISRDEYDRRRKEIIDEMTR